MKRKISINSEESGKLFRNFIKNLRKKAAEKTAESEAATELDQEKMRWDRDELYTISYETQVQRQKINETAIITEKVR